MFNLRTKKQQLPSYIEGTQGKYVRRDSPPPVPSLTSHNLAKKTISHVDVNSNATHTHSSISIPSSSKTYTAPPPTQQTSQQYEIEARRLSSAWDLFNTPELQRFEDMMRKLHKQEVIDTVRRYERVRTVLNREIVRRTQPRPPEPLN